MLQKILGVFLIVLVVLFGWAFYNAFQKVKTNGGASPTPTASLVVASPSAAHSPVASPSGSASPSATPKPTATPAVRTRSVSIDVDNDGAGQYTVPVLPGMLVRLTLNVVTTNVDPLGLRFTSPVVSTGVIAPGASKTVEFTGSQSFTLVPYAVSTGLQRPYTIQIVVQ